MSRDAAARRPDPPLRQRVLPALPRGAARPPARRGAAALGLAGRARRPDLAGARLRRPRPGPHAVRRVARDPDATSSSGPRRPRCTRARRAAATSSRCPRRTPTGCPRCRPSTPASCSRTSSTTATCKCPTCFAESSPALARRSRRSEQVLASIDARLVPRERPHRRADAVSGGEPTLYPRLAELLDEVAERPIVRVLVNTNGLRDRPGRRAARPADAAPRAGRGLPAVRRRVGRGVDPPPRRRHPPVQGAGDRAALRRRASSPRSR